MPRPLLTKRALCNRPMTLGETEIMFYEHACRLYRRRSLNARLFSALFGASNSAIAKLWMLISDGNTLHQGADGFVEPKHLLWALMFLKQYAVEEVLASTAGVTAKTFRNHVRKTMDRINACYPSVVSDAIYFFTIILI